MEEFESDSDEATEAVSDAKFLNTYKIMIEKWEMIYNAKSRLVAKNSELKEDNLKLSRQQKEKVVVESPTVFVKVADGYHGGCLTRSTMTKDNGDDAIFDMMVDLPSAWNVSLPGLPGHLYNRKILEEFGGLIGRMVKLDYNTVSKIMGHFARMAIYINFDKPFVSQSKNKGNEPMVDSKATMANTTATPMVFRPLMQVERKKHRNLKNTHNIKLKNHGKETLGLRFSILHGLVDGDEENEENMSDILNKNVVNLGQVN
ncbi:hypothetical protein Godav_027256 [Gossypium davidsonii]|uniref:DUF4283 domain-containing protein n=1 Tax=Gossypium davidsonii TaxID=34287 RepID=A0A7J8RVL4_GOSDV|nr:hypothetical protein [Gossypium davidsonii]